MDTRVRRRVVGPARGGIVKSRTHITTMTWRIRRTTVGTWTIIQNGPWCFTTDEDKNWEYCDVPFCGKLDTVNLVTFREKVGKTFHVGVIFHYSSPISFITACWFYFRVGVIFAMKTKARISENYPTSEKFPRLQYACTQMK